MNLEAKPEIFMSRMRILTMPSLKFYYVTDEPVAFQDLNQQMDILLERLYYAKQKANLRGAGPDIIRYNKVEAQKNGNDLFQMEVGIPLNDGLLAEGEEETLVPKESRNPMKDYSAVEEQVKVLPEYQCAGALHWGSLPDIATTYDFLKKSMMEQNIEASGENREWIYYFESPESTNNVLGIYLGVK